MAEGQARELMRLVRAVDRARGAALVGSAGHPEAGGFQKAAGDLDRISKRLLKALKASASKADFTAFVNERENGAEAQAFAMLVRAREVDRLPMTEREQRAEEEAERKAAELAAIEVAELEAEEAEAEHALDEDDDEDAAPVKPVSHVRLAPEVCEGWPNKLPRSSWTGPDGSTFGLLAPLSDFPAVTQAAKCAQTKAFNRAAKAAREKVKNG